MPTVTSPWSASPAVSGIGSCTDMSKDDAYKRGFEDGRVSSVNEILAVIEKHADCRQPHFTSGGIFSCLWLIREEIRKRF